MAFASGMGAISGLMLHCLEAGDHLVMSDIAYAGASELTNDIIPRLGIEVTKVNMSDLNAVRAAVRGRPSRASRPPRNSPRWVRQAPRIAEDSHWPSPDHN